VGTLAQNVLVILEVPGGTTAQYDRAKAVAGLAEEGDPPPGLVVHTCAVTDDGIAVVDVWDSTSSFEAFARDRLSTALTDAGLGRATPRISPVHALLFGTGTEPNVLVMVHTSGVTAEEYDTLVARMPSLAAGENHPAMIHVAAVEPDGLRTVGVWGSEEAYKEFAQSQLFPSIDSPRHFVLRVWPIYDYLRANPGTDG
jgi:heme-degrading monooxygenase HmoA